jgi:hypothetical protein
MNDAQFARLVRDVRGDRAVRAAASIPAKPLSELRADLAAEELGFDRNYDRSDDHRYWASQREKANKINALRLKIERLERAS